MNQFLRKAKIALDNHPTLQPLLDTPVRSAGRELKPRLSAAAGAPSPCCPSSALMTATARASSHATCPPWAPCGGELREIERMINAAEYEHRVVCLASVGKSLFFSDLHP